MNIDAVVFLALCILILLLAFKVHYIDVKLSALIYIHGEKKKKEKNIYKGNENRCVCCDEVIPEGTQYCYTCGKKAEKGEC